jgi:SNF2 family DNA or RNA helicase
MVIVLDESHNLNEIKSQRTQLFIELCKKTGCKNIIPASGTPVKAMGAELIPLLTVLDPLFTDRVQERYRKIFGKDGNKGLDILKNRMGMISHKIEKSALKLDKPIMKRLPVKMPTGDLYTLDAIRKVMEAFIQERVEFYKKRRKDDERFWERCLVLHEDTLRAAAQKMEYKKYRETLKTVIATPDPRYIGEEIAYTNLYEKKYFEPSLPKEMIKEFRDIKSIIKYTKLKIQGECLGRVLGRKRIECHVEMVKYIDFKGVADTTEKKTLVFTSFVEALTAAAAVCTSAGMSPLVVYGKTNNELASIVGKFEKDEKLNPLIATYNSLSTAVPLVMADTMIMINAPFRAYIQEQAISRIHRIGADTQTSVYQAFLDTGDKPNISTRSSEILAWSMEQVEAIMGIKSPFAVAESMEDFEVELAAQGEYDDILAFNMAISSHFKRFDIGMKGDLPTEPVQSASFMGW